MRPSIEDKVDELINDMVKQGAPLDLAEHFSLPVAFKVIYEILGIPFEVGWCRVRDGLGLRGGGSSAQLFGLQEHVAMGVFLIQTAERLSRSGQCPLVQ
jgi:hypothetical protein